MRSCRWVVFVIFTCVLLAQGQQKVDSSKSLRAAIQSATNDDSTRLPVKRVVLYKNGVGYFEHSALVRGNQDLAIDFTTGLLDREFQSL